MLYAYDTHYVLVIFYVLDTLDIRSSGMLRSVDW
jgi:hypothetical protein